MMKIKRYININEIYKYPVHFSIEPQEIYDKKIKRLCEITTDYLDTIENECIKNFLNIKPNKKIYIKKLKVL